MKSGFFLQKSLLVLMMSLLVSSMAAAQLKKVSVKNVAEPNRLSVDQQDAFELLKTLATSLKSEPDKLTAATLQAQIADVLWQFDIAFAKEVFRWSFEAASRSVPDELNESARAAYLARQASSIRQVLTRIGTHDRSQAEALLKRLQEENRLRSTSAGHDNVHSELLVQIAGALVFIARRSIVRMDHDRVGGVGQPIAGQDHVAAPGEILGNRHLAKRPFQPDVAADARADVVDGGAVHPGERTEPLVLGGRRRGGARLRRSGDPPESRGRLQSMAAGPARGRANVRDPLSRDRRAPRRDRW